MKLNKLSYRTFKQDDEFLPELWFELLIDGEPIDALIYTPEKAIPFSYFNEDEMDLPNYFSEYANKRIYTLAVCECGQGGCGETICSVEKTDEFVNFRGLSTGARKFEEEFIFSRENYDFVIDEINRKVSEYTKGSK